MLTLRVFSATETHRHCVAVNRPAMGDVHCCTFTLIKIAAVQETLHRYRQKGTQSQFKVSTLCVELHRRRCVNGVFLKRKLRDKYIYTFIYLEIGYIINTHTHTHTYIYIYVYTYIYTKDSSERLSFLIMLSESRNFRSGVDESVSLSSVWMSLRSPFKG